LSGFSIAYRFVCLQSTIRQ